MISSRLHVLAKITKADGTNIDANTAAPDLTLYSMFRKIAFELNGRNVGDTSLHYPNCSHWKNLLSFCKQKTFISFDNIFTGAFQTWSFLVLCVTAISQVIIRKTQYIFPTFWREQHRAKAQWHFGAAGWLHPEFCEYAVSKGLHAVRPGAWLRHWQ